MCGYELNKRCSKCFGNLHSRDYRGDIRCPLNSTSGPKRCLKRQPPLRPVPHSSLEIWGSQLGRKKRRAVRKLSVWYKPGPFQNTLYPKTKTWKRKQGYFKDAFRKIQAWAYTRIQTCIDYAFLAIDQKQNFLGQIGMVLLIPTKTFCRVIGSSFIFS